ncbi:glycosyl transferase family 1 [Skermanella stibiiresistens SB22]|uniref:Glycosyl transferase family 1 n=1 Tax=Skermanella stibiiresistens SB22 TaxID=1385369 RepID=W9GV70_9PROT|nr:glycosyltransferase family 4 protein [Skermanella stibiiresistens]EWY36556.1 glycosyl transferase family 1 [Skermanella stibiiresistens SB22]
MRVCFISRRFFPAISGMSVYAANLLRELVAGGHDVVMISQYRDDPAGSAVYGGGPPPAVPGVKVIGLASLGEQEVGHGRPADFEADIEAMVGAALAEHEANPFDLVHAQYGYPCGLAALEVSRRLGIPNVVSIQGGDGHWVGTCCATHKQAMLAVLNHAGALIIGSKSFAEEVRDHHGTSLDRFVIVPGATDTERFHPRADRDIAALGAEPTLLYHGRVDRRKGVMELIDAFNQLRVTWPDLRLIVSGIGPDVAAVRERVAELALGDAVEMTGHADYFAAAEVYRRGDIFVSPTYSEGFSNTILEAMSSGLPIVSTNAVGVVDCLTDGSNALLVEPRDVEGLAAAIARMLDDEALRRRLAHQALEEVRSLYSWHAIGRRIQEIYGEVAGTRPDTGWTGLYDPAEVTCGTADPSCRFRSAPHLL